MRAPIAAAGGLFAIAALVLIGTLAAAVVLAPAGVGLIAIVSLVVLIGAGAAIGLQMIADERVRDPLRPDPDARPADIKAADRANRDNFELDPRPRPPAPGAAPFVD